MSAETRNTVAENHGSSGGIPEEVRVFLIQSIDGYEQLEILLLLHRHPLTSWTAEAVGARVHLAHDTARATLELLRARHLLTTTTDGDELSYQYGPGTERQPLIDALARAYEVDRLALMRVMNANAIQRVRTAAIRTFADAFVLRKWDK